MRFLRLNVRMVWCGLGFKVRFWSVGGGVIGYVVMVDNLGFEVWGRIY